MKHFLLLLFLAFSLAGLSQHVGINKNRPQHPLDIRGDLNVDGKILLNGVAGLNGQVLSTDASGLTAWVNKGDYKHVANFMQNSTWTVPSGVNHVMIEMWGAGGGGSSGGGGASGMYILALLEVNPGSTLTLTIGLGGENATTNPGSASDGGTTIVSASSPSYLISASGGKGAGSAAPGYATSYGTFGDTFAQFPGQSGDANTFTYAQKNSTTFAIIRKYGDGGASGPNYQKRGQGQTISFNESTGIAIESNNPTSGSIPGGGGGGGSLGEDGNKGMITIWY
jgi:hypothetical protein